MLKTGRASTKRWSGKGQPLTKAKPSNVQRKPIPGLTWSGCVFATSGILTCGRVSLSPLQSIAGGIPGPKNESGEPPPAPRLKCSSFLPWQRPRDVARVRTARAVHSCDDHLHVRWSHTPSRKHNSHILLCAANCNTLKSWSPGGRLRECRSPY
jgi:hypothetical protein